MGLTTYKTLCVCKVVEDRSSNKKLAVDGWLFNLLRKPYGFCLSAMILVRDGIEVKIADAFA